MMTMDNFFAFMAVGLCLWAVWILLRSMVTFDPTPEAVRRELERHENNEHLKIILGDDSPFDLKQKGKIVRNIHARQRKLKE